MVLVWSSAGFAVASTFSTVVVTALSYVVFVALTLTMVVTVRILGTSVTSCDAWCKAISNAASAVAAFGFKNGAARSFVARVAYTLTSGHIVMSVWYTVDTVHSWMSSAC